ncbi:unnamed protein product [Gordionus sp. m RMFG-2023]|uniref:DNA-directed RNA polymerases I and III subunit RPAC1-like n=1 Tax=Gordionus sp. m RMFG-2023 TaxID=3053472 RepID=UPI0030E4E832
MDHSRIKLLEEGISFAQGEEDDQYWDINEFKKKLKIKIYHVLKTEMEFDIIGCDASLVNAIRRILISEVPIMAIDKVMLYNNTSIIPDEVLCHRLGLIPLKVNPHLFNFKPLGEELSLNPNDTLEFELNIKCSKNANAPPNSNDPDALYINNKVFSSAIKWLPIKNQFEQYFSLSLEKQPMPVNSDILIAKLIPGQVIQLKMLAFKGKGSDHAKFSPVCTAHYRYLPDIILKKSIMNEQAIKFQQCFTKGVIELAIDRKGNKIARVKDARYDQCSRNVFRYPEFKDKVELSKIRNHFVFNIESTGCLEPDTLFKESIKILMEKCQKWIFEIDIYQSKRKDLP